RAQDERTRNAQFRRAAASRCEGRVMEALRRHARGACRYAWQVHNRPHSIDGLPPSRLQLRAGPWATVLQALCGHFPQIGEATWRQRFARGRVLDEGGEPLAIDAACRVGMTVLYFREVPVEAVVPFDECI